MISLGANEVQTEKEKNLRRSAYYMKVCRQIFKARSKLREKPDRQTRRELIDKLEKLEKEQRRTPMYEMRQHAKLGYVRYADGTPVQA